MIKRSFLSLIILCCILRCCPWIRVALKVSFDVRGAWCPDFANRAR